MYFEQCYCHVFNCPFPFSSLFLKISTSGLLVRAERAAIHCIQKRSCEWEMRGKRGRRKRFWSASSLFLFFFPFLSSFSQSIIHQENRKEVNAFADGSSPFIIRNHLTLSSFPLLLESGSQFLLSSFSLSLSSLKYIPTIPRFLAFLIDSKHFTPLSYHSNPSKEREKKRKKESVKEGGQSQRKQSGRKGGDFGFVESENRFHSFKNEENDYEMNQPWS